MGDWGAKSSRELVEKAVVVLVLLLWFFGFVRAKAGCIADLKF